MSEIILRHKFACLLCDTEMSTCAGIWFHVCTFRYTKSVFPGLCEKNPATPQVLRDRLRIDSTETHVKRLIFCKVTLQPLTHEKTIASEREWKSSVIATPEAGVDPGFDPGESDSMGRGANSTLKRHVEKKN